MTRTMHDGVNTDVNYIKSIIKPGDLVAYYIDGRYAWTKEQIDMFPDNIHVTITVMGNPADVADCETGDLTPAQAAAWVIKQRTAGYARPTVYRSLAVMRDIRIATGPLVMGKDWDSWVADYDNLPGNVYAGAAAKQFRSSDNEDVSEVYDDQWPHKYMTSAPVPSFSPAVDMTVNWPRGLSLHLGHVGNRVEALQIALRDSGILGCRGITADGSFGPQTQTAVRNFEGFSKLTLDQGIAGPEVWNALVDLGRLTSSGNPVF